uniref:Skeletal aspartic acid-rich protein 3 n=1 Tax=Acropora digitifera TaxID=70779 RepID=A0A1V0CMH8_ACRDI|nr:skeletal aspartic acid-rich protein 3 [Acropora digitifera]
MLAPRLALILLLSSYFGSILITSVECSDEVDMEKKTVKMRGSNTSVLVEGDGGKISTLYLYFEEDDDDDEDNEESEDEVEDFDDENALSFQVESLQEVDESGKPVKASESSEIQHSVSSVKSLSFTVSALQNSTTYQNLTAKTVTLQAQLPNMATLELMVVLFLEDGTIKFGNETFKVLSGTMKFNINVTGWQYCDGATVSCLSDSNQPAAVGDNLDLALTVKSEAEDPEEVDDAKRAETGKDPICVDPDDPDEEDDDCPVVYDMGGNSEMVLNKGVLVNNMDYVAMPQGFPNLEKTGMMQKKLTFRLPKTPGSVIIDPSVNIGVPPKKQSGSGESIKASSFCFFTLAMLLSVLIAHF